MQKHGWLKRVALIALPALSLGLAAPAGAEPSSDELAAFKQAIRAKYDMKERAFHERDAETIVTRFYSADVTSIGEGSPVHRGREELRKLYTSPEVINSEVRIVSWDTHVDGNAGWDWADFHVTPADPETAPFTFKILFLWEKVDGEWWCKGDMYVVDHGTGTPAAGTPAH